MRHVSGLLGQVAMPPDEGQVSTVVILSDFAHIEGGGGKVAINEALLLARSGLRVIFLAAVGPIDPLLTASTVEVNCLGQDGLLSVSTKPGIALQAIWNRSAYARMKRVLDGLDPQRTVIHLHGYTKALSTSPLAAARKRNFRVICTLHDFFSACPNGAFFDYVRQEPCTRVALSANCLVARCDKRHPTHKLFRVARSVVQRVAARFPSEVMDYIVLSDRSATILRQYVPPSARFHRLANMIDVAKRAPVAAAENRLLLCVGRLDKEKGVTFLADAASSVGMQIVFVGDGPMRSELAQRDNVTITGWLSPPEVISWLDRARTLIFPSLWYETFGLVVAEAAARGVPAIVSDVTAAAERVIDGVTGWHFVSGNAASLSATLKLTLQDEAVAAAGSAAYDRFWQSFPSDGYHAMALRAIYESMLAVPAAPAIEQAL